VPDWLRDAALVESPISPAAMATRLFVAALFGVVIALVYRLSHGRLARDARTLVGTLVLLTILLAMVTMVIGDSVARAFGLVGALSIVRFRTVVEDTRDTAFVIFAVVVGMAVGTGLVLVAAIGVPVVAVAALALSVRSTATVAPALLEGASTLAVRLGGGHAPQTIDAFLQARVEAWRLVGVSTARQGAALDLSYQVRLREDAAPGLVSELNTVAGVQSVDLRTPGAPA
jgi:hypothetical protein